MRIETIVNAIASVLIENWLFNGWENRTPLDEIQCCGNDGTAAVGLSGDERLALAEEWFEEVGAMNESISLLGLSGAIWNAACASLQSKAENLAKEFAQSLEDTVACLQFRYKNDFLRSVGVSDQMSYCVPMACKDLEEGNVYQYRRVDGGYDSDVIDADISASIDGSFSLNKTIYIQFDIYKPCNQAA